MTSRWFQPIWKILIKLDHFLRNPSPLKFGYSSHFAVRVLLQSLGMVADCGWWLLVALFLFSILGSEINRLREAMEDQGKVWENNSDGHENTTKFSFFSTVIPTSRRNKNIYFSVPRHPNKYLLTPRCLGHDFGALLHLLTRYHQVWLDALGSGVDRYPRTIKCGKMNQSTCCASLSYIPVHPFGMVHIGSKVSVPTLHMHLVALYDYMDVPVHGSFVQTLAQNWGYKNFDFKSRLLQKALLQPALHSLKSNAIAERWSNCKSDLLLFRPTPELGTWRFESLLFCHCAITSAAP